MSAERYETVISGGTVVTDGWSGLASVAIRGEQVVGLLDPSTKIDSANTDTVIDATGMVVMPGGVDPHCHLAIPLGAFMTLDDFRGASLAALAGGTTTIVDFAIPSPGQDPVVSLDEKIKMALESRCDYAFHGCLATAPADVDAVVAAFAARGVRTIKLFTTYRGELMVDTQTIESVMKSLQRVSGLTYIHAEENTAIEVAQTQAEHAGRIGASSMTLTRPEQAEVDAVSQVLAAAERSGSPVYFVHQSIAGAVGLVHAARARGVRAYSETCPHYLAPDASCYDGPFPERFVCCPPIRETVSRDELVGLVASGFVHTIGSDHCCYGSDQKASCAHDVRLMPNGLPGVETRLPVVWSKLVATGRMSAEAFVALMSANPARLNGLFPRKGSLAPGSDADVVVLDPTMSRVVRSEELHMSTDYTPYEGENLTGWPVHVLSRGRLVMSSGELVDPGPTGVFQSAGAIATW